MSAIDSQYEEPFDDESDFSEPELSDADGQDRGRGENRKCQPEEDGQEQSARWYTGTSKGHFSSQSIWMISRTKFQSLQK